MPQNNLEFKYGMLNAIHGQNYSGIWKSEYQQPMQDLINDTENPEETRQQYLLTLHLAESRGVDEGFVWDNFESMKKEYFGKETSNSEAFNYLKNYYSMQNSRNDQEFNTDKSLPLNSLSLNNPQQQNTVAPQNVNNDPDFVKGVALSLGSGAVSTTTGAWGLWKMFDDMSDDLQYKYLDWVFGKDIMDSKEMQEVHNINDQFNNRMNSSISEVNNVAINLRKNAGIDDSKSLVDSFDDGIGAGTKRLALEMVGQAPQLAMLLFGGGATMIGATSAGSKYNDIKDDKHLADWQKYTNASLSGVIEGTMEQLITLPILKRSFAKVGSQVAKRTLAKSLWNVTKNAGQEASEEAIVALANNVVDLSMGVNGVDATKLTPKENFSYLTRNAVDGAILGFFMGGAISSTGTLLNRINNKQISHADADLILNNATEQVEQLTAELENKENLTDAEKEQLNILQTGNLDLIINNDLINTAVTQRQEKQNSNAPKQNEFINEIDAENNIEDDNLSLEDRAVIARKKRLMPQFVEKNSNAINQRIAETVNTLNIDNKIINIVEDINTLPQNILTELQENGYDNRAMAFVKDDKVYFLTQNLNEINTEYAVLHELVGHYGLNKLLDNKLDGVLDGVFRSQEKAVKDFVLSRNYNDIDLNAPEGQRLAAEEYLSDIAGKNKKAGKIDGIYAKIKAVLRKAFPKLRFTNREISGIISNSKKNLQRQNNTPQNNNSLINPQFATDLKFARDAFLKKLPKQQQTKLISLIEAFKQELDGVELNNEQQNIHDVVTGKKKSTTIRKSDLEHVKDFVSFEFGNQNFGSAHVLLRHLNSKDGVITANDIINIGEIVRNGKLKIKEKGKKHVYTLWKENTRYRAVIGKQGKKKTLITFYTNKESKDRVHNDSPGMNTHSFNSSTNNIAEDSGNVKFSLASIDPQTQDNYAAEIAPRILKREITNIDQVKEYFSQQINDVVAENILFTAKKLAKAEKSKLNARRNRERYSNFIADNYDLLNKMLEMTDKGKLYLHDRFKGEDFENSFLTSNPKKGFAIDSFAKGLEVDYNISMDEQEIFDYFQHLSKASINENYRNNGTLKAQKKHAELEMFRFRNQEIKEIEQALLYGNEKATAKLIKQYPELTSFVEELLSKDNKDFDLKKSTDRALANLVARNTTETVTKRLETYQLLRELLTSKSLEKNMSTDEQQKFMRELLAKHGAKLLPDEKSRNLYTPFKKTNITPKQFEKALKLIDDNALTPSKKAVLNDELIESRKLIKQLYDKDIANKIDLTNNVDEMVQILVDELPFLGDNRNSDGTENKNRYNLTRYEMERILKKYKKLVDASTGRAGMRKVVVRDNMGQPVKKNGKEQYVYHLDKDGKIKTKKDGSFLHKWEANPTYRTPRQKIVKEIFEIIDTAATRDITEKTREKIINMLEKTESKKDNRGRPYSIVTPETQIELDNIRKLTKLEASEVEDLQENLAAKVFGESDNSELQKQLADLQLFGNLKNSNYEQLYSAQESLKHLIDTGRTIHYAQIQNDKLANEARCEQAINAITGDGEVAPPNNPDDGFLHGLNDFHRNNLSFEWLLNSFARNDKNSGTLENPVFKEFCNDVHKSTQKESTQLRVKQNNLQKQLKNVFGTKNHKAFLHRLDSLKAEQNSEIILFEGEVKEQRSIALNDFETELDQMQDNINNAVYSNDTRVAQQAELDADRKLLNDAKINNKRVIKKLGTIKIEGLPTEQKLSQLEALNYYLASCQEDIRQKMLETGGWRKESFEQLEKFLLPETKEIGKFLQAQYDSEYDSINEIYQKYYFINLPKIENYCPASFKVTSTRIKDIVDGVDGVSSVNPGSLISRKLHGRALAQTDALTLYLQHTAQMEHFKAWAGTMKNLRGTFGNEQVAENVKNYFGNRGLKTIMDKVNMFADGGNRNADSIKWLDMLRKNFTVAKLAWNVGVFAKQLTSLPAYAFDMPLKSYVKYQTQFFKNPSENIKMLLDTDFIKNRLKEGYERDVMRLLHDLKGKDNFLAQFAEKGMMLGQAGDIVPVLVGGYASYQYNYDNFIAQNYIPEIAHEKAILAWEMNTERAQQAGHVKDLGNYQAGGSVARLFTMFTTSPRQYYQYVYETALDFKAGRKVSKKKLGRTIFIGQFVLPLLFQGVTDLMRKGWNTDEYEEEDYLRAITLGPLNGLFILGSVADSIATGVTTGKAYNNNGVPVMTALSKAGYAAVDLHKFFNDGFESKDLINASDDLLDFASGTSKTMAFVDIFKREGKRFGVPFLQKKKKKKGSSKLNF